MPKAWKAPTYSAADVDDFIIADDDVEDTVNSAQPNLLALGQTAAQLATDSQFGFSNLFSSFTPKVDLGNTFAPFTSGIAQNTTVLERQYTGGDTLDEPIWQTLQRDLLQIGRRLAIVIWPMQLQSLANKQQQNLVALAAANGISVPELIMRGRRISVSQNPEGDMDVEQLAGSNTMSSEMLEWDLWGPLIFSLLLAVALGLSASRNQTNVVFSGSFCFTWISFLIIGINIQLLGGTISFLLAISATGYSMFPLVLGELISWLLLKNKFLRFFLMLVLNAWSIFAGVMSLRCSGVLPGKVLLAIYPVGLMYSIISWLVVIT